MSESTDQPLTGRTIVLTAHRKAAEFALVLERRGATIWHAPVLSVASVHDEALLEATRHLLHHPPDVVIVTTGVGFRGWLQAADEAGLGDDLRVVLSRARLLARGAKAQGAIRGEGLECDWVAGTEQAAEIRDLLLAESSAGRTVAGRRVAVQHHGSGADGLDDLVAGLGAEVTSLVVYRWAPSPDPEAVAAAVRAVAAQEVDAVVFTAAPGAREFLERAQALGLLDEVVRGFQQHVVAATVGPVTAAPLQEAGIAPLVPARFRTGALVRDLTERLSDGR